MAQTIRDLYAAKAEAGKPVSASKVSGGTSVENKKKKTLSELAAEAYSRAAWSGTDNPPAAGGGSPLYTRGPSTVNSKKTLSQLAAEQAAKAYSRPAGGPSGTPAPTYTPGAREAADQAERGYMAAADAYKAAMAEMQMAAQSGGYVSADVAERVRQAQQEQARAQQMYGQAAAAYEEQAYKERLGRTQTDTDDIGELLRQQRIQQSENAMYAQAGDYAAQARLALRQRELNEQIEAYREALRGEGYSDAEIRSLEGYLTRQRNAEETERMAEETRKRAAKSSAFENLTVNVGAGLMGGISYADLALQNALGGKDAVTGRKALVDYNTDAQQMYHASEATMQGQMDKLLEEYGVTDENGNRDLSTEGKIRSGAYQLMVSMGQSAAVAGLTAMGAPGAMLLLSGNAAASTTHEFHEKGFSDGTALMMGAISGAAEYVTEKIGMDNLFKTRDLSTTKHMLRTLLKNMGSQAMAEGGEEVLSTVINTLADLMVNGDRNALTLRYEELMAAGYTEAQAKEIAGREWLHGVVNDFVMGGLSGMLFGMGGTAFQGARNAVVDTASGREILKANQADTLRGAIDRLDANIREAANVPSLEENAGARQLGAAQRGMERAGVMDSMRSELAARGEENPSQALLSGLYAASQEQEQRLTKEERKALRGSEAARELVDAWRQQWDDGSVPAPFAGMADYVLGQGQNKTSESDAESKRTKDEILESLPQEIKVGKTTTISNPYKGPVPVQNYLKSEPVQVSKDSVSRAEANYAQAAKEARDTGGYIKTILSRLYSSFKGPKGVKVNGMQFEGHDYTVDVPNGLPGKLASQGTSGIEYTILDNLAEIISNGEYLGSGYGVLNGNPKNKVTRYDYFETEVSLNGTPHTVRWEVEIVPGANNYKTHRLTNIEIDPESAAGPPAKSGRNPTDTGSKKDPSDPIDIIPHDSGNSNNNFSDGSAPSQNDGTGENGTGAEAVNTNGSEADLSQNQPTAENGTETAQQEFDRLRAELDEPDHDAEYYQSRGRRLNELMEQGAKPAGSEQKTAENEQKAPANGQKTEKTDNSRGPIGKDGIRTVKAEDAAEELMDIGEARVKNDAGTFLLSVRRKSDTNYLARVDHNGKLAASKSFETAEEAAAYAQSWVEGRTQGQEDAELDLEKSEPKEPQNALEQLLDPEAYQKEARRQKENKAAQAATQTLRERIWRAQSELNALRRLEKSTGLTEAQKKHKADVQETLDIMNDELTSRKGRRQAKKEKAKATGNKPTRSAAEAKNALMDLFHTPAGERSDTGRAIEQKLTEIFESGKLTDEGRQELFDLLMEKGETVKHAEQLYEAIRRDLKGTRIYVSEEDRKGYGDNWDDLRRRAWAAGIYLTNNINDKGADVHNLEFSEVYGERTFPTDIAAQDMLENMIDLAEKGRPTKRSLREALEEEARQERMDPEEVFGDMWNRMEETLRSYAEKAGLEVDLKNRTASQLADERQRWQERLDKRSQARRESEIRGKLLNGLKRLERVRNKTAPEIKEAIEEILQDIDTQARQITPAGLEDLQALQRAYLDARKAAGYENDENMGNWIPNPYVEKRLEALTKKHVNDMDLQEVIELGRTVAGLEHAIATHNQMIGEEWDSTIEQEANGVRDEVSAAKGAKPGFFQKWFMEEHLSPRRFLEMLGGWKDGSMKKLSRSLEDGQTRALDFQRRATQSFDPFLTKKENRKWLEKASGKKAVWEKYTVVDGVNEDGASFTEIELTPMMKISLYLHSRNMDNLRHIQTGGIVIPNKELYKAGKIADAYELGDRVKMNPETVRKIAGELSAVEKSFANHMIRVFDTISKDAINEVSMQLDGFERAGVENYMPIETDRNFIKSDVAGEARAQTVEGIGSIANERIHASNPVMLIDASDVLTRQIDKVSRYYGYAIPIRNFQAVNNYVFHEEGAPFSTSVKELMGKKWGTGAEQYITKMLQDLQSSGRSSDMTSRALSALRGHLAGATLAFNPAVAVSQTASYPGAAQAVGWDGLAAGLIGGKVDTKLIEKYTPLYWYRNQGNSTQELGDVMKEKSMEQKLPWVFNWIQKMDSATIRRLWKAAEYRVSKDTGLKPGSQAEIDAGKDAYYKAVAEVFNRAVYDTQPNYTNMERAQILRSDSDVTRFLTMYKTVPLQYYGMMVEATGRLRAAAQSGDKAQIAKAQKYALDTFGGLLAANTVYVTMKALFKTFRKKDKDYRDEEGNITAGSYARQLSKDLVETYAGSIIGGSEALSAIQSLATGKKWTGPDMSSLSYLEEMWNAVGDITDAMGEEDPRKAAKAIKNSAETLAMGFGVPAKNMETYIMATVRRISPRIGMEYDNMFGGIQKSDLKSMDGDAVSMAAGLILSNRTGVNLGKAVNDELARLYGAGFTDVIPSATPESFTYNGEDVEIKDRRAYSEAWGRVVGDNLEELLTSDEYLDADDRTKKNLISKLYQYATVQARKTAVPDYNVTGNSTYGWTEKADAWVKAGASLSDAVAVLTSSDDSTYEIKDPKTYEETWSRVVDSALSEIVNSDAYATADEKAQKSMVNKLYQYATVQARKKDDPTYSVTGNSTYGWTEKADSCMETGISIPDTIKAMVAIGSFTADKDEDGNSISGSKKEKVVEYIDGLDLTIEQKDELYITLGGYKENTLNTTPWHNGSGKYSKSFGRSGGGRSHSRSGGRSSGSVTPAVAKAAAKGSSTTRDTDYGIEMTRALFGGTGKGSGKTDATEDIVRIVDKYYGGNPLLALADGGRKIKGRTKVDFEL